VFEAEPVGFFQSNAIKNSGGQVFILDGFVKSGSGFAETQNAQDAKLLAPVIFMYGWVIADAYPRAQ
jgi:hypothetical protein